MRNSKTFKNRFFYQKIFQHLKSIFLSIISAYFFKKRFQNSWFTWKIAFFLGIHKLFFHYFKSTKRLTENLSTTLGEHLRIQSGNINLVSKPFEIFQKTCF
jgi:hypothetical protein